MVIGASQGAADPQLALLVPSFIWRWHGTMQRQWKLGFRAKDSCSTALLPYINRGVELPSTTHNKRAREEKELHCYLALARIRVGVSEERVGEVPGLSATSLSVLATLSRRVLELATRPLVPL